jgi:hypothetical protein
MIWLFSGAHEDPEDETVIGNHGAKALNSAVKSLMHAIWTVEQDTQQDAGPRMIQIGKYWTIRRWPESRLANGKPLVQIQKQNAHLIDLERTEDEQAKLKTLVERYTSQGASEAWRVNRWWLACISFLFGDTEDRNDVSGQCSNAWPHDPWVDSLNFRWLREAFWPMLVNAAAEYPEPDQDKAANETLLYKHQSHSRTLPLAPPPQMGVRCHPLPGQDCHLKWWLTKFFGDHSDIF